MKKQAFGSIVRGGLAVGAALGMVLLANGTAMAADQWVYWTEGTDDIEIDLHRDGTFRGYGVFNADPSGLVNPIPGDAFQACDKYADGKGIEIQRRFEGGSWKTMATTRGFNAPYCSLWETDNMPEETFLGVRVCIVEGTHRTCSDDRWTWA
ncbi:hypothetical protein [Streptomyces adelaidensis]|uniref:hypothetical protein n=1 Tax=Streptomyces adelaidensis TaxID=2796465 RepID=UPI00190339F2|nr:hypothetical protein [Streptomyces adelaidensis]